MKKDECEQKIRYLCSKWANERGILMSGEVDPSFQEFLSWMRDNGWYQYLDFRAQGGPLYVAQMWFDQEFKQSWKN